MKTFWPTFWPTLTAILVAAALIGLFIEIKSYFDAEAATEARIAVIKAETTALNARLEKNKRDKAAFDARMEDIRKELDKRNADFRKAHGFPEPIYPTLEEAFKSPTPQPSAPEP